MHKIKIKNKIPFPSSFLCHKEHICLTHSTSLYYNFLLLVNGISVSVWRVKVRSFYLWLSYFKTETGRLPFASSRNHVFVSLWHTAVSFACVSTKAWFMHETLRAILAIVFFMLLEYRLEIWPFILINFDFLI